MNQSIAQAHAPVIPERRLRAKNFYKSGTIERIIKHQSFPDGIRLSGWSKLIAIALLSYAWDDLYCSVSDRQLCADLNCDEKTLRKHFKQLFDVNLVVMDRNRAGAGKRYDVQPIYRLFGEERAPQSAATRIGDKRGAPQTGKLSRSADRETDREILPVRPGNRGASDPETFPVSNPSPTSSISIPSLTEAAERLGFEPTAGTEDDVIIVAALLEHWSIGKRQQRATVKRYGFRTVANACAYVHNEISIPGNLIREPAGLFFHAVKERKYAMLPDIASVRTGKDSRSGSSRPDERQIPTETGKVSRSEGEGGDQVLDHLAPQMAATMEISDAQRLLDNAREAVRGKVNEVDYGMFVKGLTVAAVDETRLQLRGIVRFMLPYAEERVLRPLTSALRTITGNPDVTIEFVE